MRPGTAHTAAGEITVDAPQASSRRGAEGSHIAPRPIGDPRGAAVAEEGRWRRAFEGQLMSRMRTQARRRGSGPGAPGGSRSAASVTGGTG